MIHSRKVTVILRCNGGVFRFIAICVRTIASIHCDAGDPGKLALHAYMISHIFTDYLPINVIL